EAPPGRRSSANRSISYSAKPCVGHCVPRHRLPFGIPQQRARGTRNCRPRPIVIEPTHLAREEVGGDDVLPVCGVVGAEKDLGGGFRPRVELVTRSWFATGVGERVVRDLLELLVGEAEEPGRSGFERLLSPLNLLRVGIAFFERFVDRA